MEVSSTSDAAWGEEPARKKRRIPPWVWWGCGGGCLLVTLIVAGLAVFSVRLFKDATDPEKQWPALAKVLPFDTRPEGLELMAGVSVGGVSQFYLNDHAHSMRATVIEFGAGSSAEASRLLDPDLEAPFGLGNPVEPEKGTVTVQGREVPCLRFARIKPEPAGGEGPGIRVDLTGKGTKPRTFELRRHAEGRIEDADIEAFLAPFDVWRER